MERAREKAREIGRSLLSMASGGGSSEEHGEKIEAKRRSWSDVVSSPPLRGGGNLKGALAGKPTPSTAGMPATSSSQRQNHSMASFPGRGGSPQRIFSAADVAKLVEIARNQLRKEKEFNSGWKEVESKETKKKEKSFVRELLEGYQSSPDSQFRCWQCDEPGHKSSECPQGERCFHCNGQGHKRSECPAKRRASRAEKGKSLDIGEERCVQVRAPVGVRIGEQRQGMVKEEEKHRGKALQGRLGIRSEDANKDRSL